MGLVSILVGLFVLWLLLIFWWVLFLIVMIMILGIYLGIRRVFF